MPRNIDIRIAYRHYEYSTDVSRDDGRLVEWWNACRAGKLQVRKYEDRSTCVVAAPVHVGSEATRLCQGVAECDSH